VCGATGSAKTRVLHALAEQGQQTLDLEGLACHKGSLLGGLPDVPQPSQTAFETAIGAVLEKVDPARPLYVEGESRRIGRLNVPIPLIDRMRESPCVEVRVPPAARLDYLLRDYAYLGERPEWLAGQFETLKPLHGKEVIGAWQAMALAGDLAPLFSDLATRHYDPAYARSQRAHFRRWADRLPIESDGLAPEDIADIARRVAEAGPGVLASAG